MESLEKYINLDLIMTLTEASEKWGFSNGSTIRKAIERGKFKSYEIRRSGNVWLITYDAMNRVFGEPSKTSNDYIISLDEISKLYRQSILGKNVDYLKCIEETKIKLEKAIDDGSKVIVERQITKDRSMVVIIIKTKEELDRWILYARSCFELTESSGYYKNWEEGRNANFQLI